MIRHVASVGEVVEDVEAAAAFYRGLGLEVVVENGYGRVEVPGILHFGLWDRRDAAEAILGSREAADRITPGFRIGFEVDSVDAAVPAIDPVGAAKDEPWGQRVVRFLSPSGVASEFAETSWARELETDVAAKQPENAST